MVGILEGHVFLGADAIILRIISRITSSDRTMVIKHNGCGSLSSNIFADKAPEDMIVLVYLLASS